jgi:hypothetical protein
MKFARSIYFLYRAGILTGSDGGNFLSQQPADRGAKLLLSLEGLSRQLTENINSRGFEPEVQSHTIPAPGQNRSYGDLM